MLDDGRELPACLVEIEGGRIAAVEPDAGAPGDLVVGTGWIAPGLVDLHVHGAGGVDLASAEKPAEALHAMARTLARHGVTAFCPALVSLPPEAYARLLRAFRSQAIPGAAECLGSYLEGPYLNPAFRGVHDPLALRVPDLAEVDGWLVDGPPSVVTLAPELDGALEVARRLVAAGVVVSLGHSGADLAAARAGLGAGAMLGTHLFNAMPPIHHRQPGLVGALLASEATVEVIADSVHLDPVTVDLVARAAGPARVALVTDALAPAGAPPGPSTLGEQAVVSDGISVRRADGTLAGSATLLDASVRNVIGWLPWLPPAEVVRMATQTPATVLGPAVARRKGRVAPGYDADLAIFDAAWRVTATVVHGELLRWEDGP